MKRSTLVILAAAWLVNSALPTAVGQVAGNATVSNAQLLQRLEAAEAELSYLRTRDRERTEWEESVIRRLPEPDYRLSPVTHRAADSPGGCDTVATSDGCGCQPPPCPGVPPYCDCCLESLSWNKSPWRIVPFGALTGEAIAATGNTVARPMVLYMGDDRGDSAQYTVHGQTTALGLNFSGPQIGTFQSGGMILFNFLGSRPILNQSSPFFLRGYGELRNEAWRFAFGQQGDLFNPLNPVTVNFGGHKQAGNGGSFRGSIRLERFFQPRPDLQWMVQGAISQQVVNDFIVDPRIIGVDNGWPNVEGRVGMGIGSATSGSRPLELGVSGVIGETRSIGILGAGVHTTWGISPDIQYRSERWGFGGELFMGQAIGTYNLGIGQSLDPTGFRAIRTVGGWGNVWWKLTPRLTTHVGYGIDDPRNNDTGQFLSTDPVPVPIAGQRIRNEVAWINLIWDVTQQFDLAFEVSYRETVYLAPSITNNGTLYHFRARLKF